MKFTAALLVALPLAVYAQRITGDATCVNSCYQISVAVTQCRDLTDAGVVSCICPNSTQVTNLDACHGCIGSLNGITDLETNSINTLYGACKNGGSLSSAASSPASGSGTLAGGTTATSGVGANAAQTNTPNGAGFQSSMVSGSAAIGALLLAAIATVSL